MSSELELGALCWKELEARRSQLSYLASLTSVPGVMARVGIVGGLGPESTIDYYRRIIDAWKRHHPDDQPSIVIDSLDVRTGLHLAANDHAGLTEYLSDSVGRLAAAGADFVAMSANTAHLVFDAVAARSPVPLISIVATCAAEARRLNVRRAGLFGTRFTMEAGFYPAEFAKFGIEVVVPNAEERAWIHERYVSELLKGDCRDATRGRMVQIIDRLKAEESIDAVILGGTELPLLLRSADGLGIPALDTTALHIEAIDGALRRA